MSISSYISKFNRSRKYDYFMNYLKPTAHSKILDVGFANVEYSDNDNYLEKHYPHPHNITALGVDGKDIFEKHYPDVKAILYTGKDFPFADNSFDYGWSNAVIEHVGCEQYQIHFLKEMMRTCKRVYLTTPNRYFPIELHTRLPFIHWLPKKQCDNLLRRLGKQWATGDYMYLLSKKKIIDLCNKAGAKNIRIKPNKIMGLTMDYCITINTNL